MRGTRWLRPAAGREAQRGLRVGLLRAAREAQLCAARDGCVRLLAGKHSAVSELDCFAQPESVVKYFSVECISLCVSSIAEVV
jgi:hypothetical protein